MWRHGVLDAKDAAYRRAGDRAFATLDLLARVDRSAGCDRTDPVMAPTMAAWSMVHGYARLAIEGGFGIPPAPIAAPSEATLVAVLDHLTL